MRLNSSGNLGIGVAAPAAKLDVRGGNFGNNQEIGINLGVPDGQWMSGMFLRSNSLGQPRLSLDVPVDGAGSTGEKVSITHLGKVGIGTDTPDANLEVYNTGYTSLLINGNNTSETQLRFKGGTAARITNEANTAIIFNTNSDEKLRIDADGDVGIGTGDPAGKLHVRAADECNLVVREEATSLVLSAETNSGRDNNRVMTLEGSAFVFNESGNEKARIDSSGRVGIGTDNPYTTLQVRGGTQSLPVLGEIGAALSVGYGASFGLTAGCIGTGKGFIQVQRLDGTATAYDLSLQALGGNVGIGTDSPDEKLHVAGTIKADNFDIGGITKDSYLRKDINDTASGDLTFNGRTNIRGGLDISDGQNVDFGSSDDIKIYYQGSKTGSTVISKLLVTASSLKMVELTKWYWKTLVPSDQLPLTQELLALVLTTGATDTSKASTYLPSLTSEVQSTWLIMTY